RGARCKADQIPSHYARVHRGTYCCRKKCFDIIYTKKIQRGSPRLPAKTFRTPLPFVGLSRTGAGVFLYVCVSTTKSPAIYMIAPQPRLRAISPFYHFRGEHTKYSREKSKFLPGNTLQVVLSRTYTKSTHRIFQNMILRPS
ncbi:unnamed protein product, partial [Ectocarpus sp. 12 AP-2014]